ncbi:hypothetical protein E6O75_ATG09430 [Venturia nashicola]|uniref:Uncharacterized protein n=1 Tax=Venturia nashicola TaxID=86259 RepID=A0A4Z1NG85_9PEZI|nr:hypothetical protein E6O75_ATG09430 [Venturia nashicola]
MVEEQKFPPRRRRTEDVPPIRRSVQCRYQWQSPSFLSEGNSEEGKYEVGRRGEGKAVYIRISAEPGASSRQQGNDGGWQGKGGRACDCFRPGVKGQVLELPCGLGTGENLTQTTSASTVQLGTHLSIDMSRQFVNSGAQDIRRA